MIAISGDDRETAMKFRDSLKAPFPFVSDADGTLMKRFDVKYPLLTTAKRVTFLVGEKRRILAIQEGSDAIDPSTVVSSCSLEKPKMIEAITAPRDGGVR